MGVTSQSRASHHNNMKVFVALAGLVAVTSAYPMFLLEDAEAAYAPVYRMARQVRPPQMADDFVPGSRFAEAARRRIQEEEDLDTAADAAYGAAPLGQDLPRPPGGGSRRRRTWTLQLMPHMAPRPWVALRSRFTAAPARETMTSHHGVTTTPSPLTLPSIIKHNHHHRHHH